MNKFLVLKQFAKNSDIFHEGEILEMDAVEAKSLTDNGTLKPYTEKAGRISVEIDQKGIADAVREGLASLAPKVSGTAATETKMGFGEFLQGIAKKTINITTNTQGEYATTELLDPSIDVDLLEQSGIASRARMTPLTGNQNIYKMNVVNSMGTAPAVTAESGTISASQPTVTQFSFTMQKLTYRFDVTEEALEDTGALVSEISGQAPEEFSKYVEDGMINGAGPFTGIVGDTNTNSIAKETGQTDGTIVAENIDKMFSAAKRPASSVWILSRSAYGAVQGLEDSAGNRIFQGPTGIAGNVFGTLKGLPIVVSDYAQAVGTVGDIILANLSKYRIVAKGGLRMASSAHVKFLSDETVFKLAYRAAGKPTGIKQTATDGTVVADFITLQNRGS